MHLLHPDMALANMGTFIVRVELFEASGEDYERLHERMSRIGFCKQVVGDDGRIFDLPPAEYCGETPLPFNALRDLIQRLAGDIGPAAVLVTEAQRMAWTLPLAS